MDDVVELEGPLVVDRVPHHILDIGGKKLSATIKLICYAKVLLSRMLLGNMRLSFKSVKLGIILHTNSIGANFNGLRVGCLPP